MSELASVAPHVAGPKRQAKTTLKRFAQSLVPSRADFCFIHLTRGKYLRCAACAHCTREGERVIAAIVRAYQILRSDPVSTVAHVVRHGRPQLRVEIAADEDPRLPARIAAAHRQLAPTSALAVPLLADSRIIGALTLGYSDSGRRFGTQDIPRAVRLAKQVSIYLETGVAPALRVKPMTRAGARRLVPLRARV
jgi:GAF domain-containing protein